MNGSTKNLGAIKITFEALERLLDIKEHSISTIEVDTMTQTVMIIHNDKGRGAIKISEGMTIFETIIPLRTVVVPAPREREESEW